MTAKTKTRKMALFCDFENIALGVLDAKYAAFDIQKVLERLLLEGSIVVKRAYCGWDRYREFKGAMDQNRRRRQMRRVQISIVYHWKLSRT